MRGLKIYLDEDLEKRFRRMAMEIFGFGRGSISRAAEDAIRKWVLEYERIVGEIEVPEDPVRAIRGMLRHVKKSSVELQHEVRELRRENLR